MIVSCIVLPNMGVTEACREQRSVSTGNVLSYRPGVYPIAPSAPSKSNEPKRVNLGGGERRTTTK
ncbi:hypothetical protein BZG77_01575 [Salinivibrio sp. IB643]|nr:hypothetical protein BZG77_01575 [Salinivibrio sp. IB643]